MFRAKSIPAEIDKVEWPFFRDLIYLPLKPSHATKWFAPDIG